MNELMRLYENVFIPSWEGEGEPPSFEDWKNNDFKEWLKDYVDNKDYEWEAMLINTYAKEVMTNIPVCYDMYMLNDYDFTDVYDRIDHDNFNIRHDVYWEDECGYIHSGNYCDFVDKYWDDDILDYVIRWFDTFDIDPNEYSC